MQKLEILKLSPKGFEKFLKDELNVKSEEDVFKAAMDWITYDLATRKVYLERVFKHVRFPLMSGMFLS